MLGVNDECGLIAYFPQSKISIAFNIYAVDLFGFFFISKFQIDGAELKFKYMKFCDS